MLKNLLEQIPYATDIYGRLCDDAALSIEIMYALEAGAESTGHKPLYMINFCAGYTRPTNAPYSHIFQHSSQHTRS